MWAGADAQNGAPIQRALSEMPAGGRHPGAEHYIPPVVRFYAARQFQPLWTDATGVTPAGRSLLAALARADREGLEADEYHVSVPESLGGRPESTAPVEVEITFAALRFAHDLGWGITLPAAVDRANSYEPRPFDAEQMLARLASARDPGAELLSVAPATPAYALLREALARLRTIRDRGGWTMVADGATLRQGDAGPSVQQLRSVLVERGDLPETAAVGDQFDPVLAAALVRFQTRHGLEADGLFGAATRAAFNVPIGARIRQVRLGLERLRWLPPQFSGRRIGVNLAAFTAYVIDDQTVTFEARTVIGRPYQQTPMFSALMTYVVINPYWNVPPSIARNEILPQVARDPDYLSRHAMEIVDGAVRQRPGPSNALGLFKFMFPNVHAVYLHDTPARTLFDRTSRAFSHGCIRVDHAADLAAVLLEPQGWTPERIAGVVKSGRQTIVTLDHPIPVHITYATAFLDPGGTLHFRPDIYGRDARLIEALEARRRGAWQH